ncbi:MAG: phage tail assembly chaperone [Novosphingobium sp.]|nr:phage tail assembly chaperone [Novosphingobium sp.]
MSGTFAESAQELAGQTALLLGWRPADFWAATPAELAAIFAVRASIEPPSLSREHLTTMLEQDRNG